MSEQPGGEIILYQRDNAPAIDVKLDGDIRPKSEIPISHYLLCLLCSSDYKQKLLGSSESGSTRQALTKTEIEALSVLFPCKKVLENFEEKARAVFTYWDNLTHQNNTLNQVLQNLLSMLATSRLQ